MRVLLAQINPTIGNFSGNTAKIESALDFARQNQVELVVFPELALTGYPPGDLLLLPHFIERAAHSLKAVIAGSKDLTVIVGVPRCNAAKGEKKLFNSAAIIHDKKLLGFQDKTLLPTYDVFDELRYFEPSAQLALWQIAGKKVAITICEDIWQHSLMLEETHYKNDPLITLAALKPDLAINLSASPFALGKWQKRLAVSSAAAKTLKAPFLLCNQVGGNDSLIFDGRSFYMDQEGSLIECAKAFEEDLFIVDLAKEPKKASVLPIDNSQEIYEALICGVRDYFQKLGFSKACIALSGGIDSAVVACIAAAALGPEHVQCIGMPSRYSSQGSIKDAKLLAANLKVDFKIIPIESVFQNYLDLLEPYFAGLEPNITEENLQARIRGMIAMAFSNKFGSIVLSTGNKSELAVGYSTLYGDMCGGLAVIGDLTKQQVYALAGWINRYAEVIPKVIIEKEPSAELRYNQKDSDSLPAYYILDTIVQAYIEKHMPPEQIAKNFNFPLSLVEDIVQRIHRNEYKRRQSAPALRISSKAFSVGREFPIVQRFV